GVGGAGAWRGWMKRGTRDVRGAPRGGIVAARVADLLDEPRFEPGALGARERDRVGGVAEHLTALEARDVVEEPAARRHRPQHAALHFDEPRGVLVTGHGCGGAGGLEKRPGPSRHIAPLAVVDHVHLVCEPLHREAQPCTPRLLRGAVGVDLAAAGPAPPLDTMRTAPR